MAKKRLKPEEIIYKLKTEVEEAYFAANPLKTFPDDFLSKSIKKELAEPIEYPDVFKIKSGITITGRDHKIRRKMTKNKINLAQIKKACEIAEKMNEVKGAKYTEVLLPSGKLKLTAMKRFGIGFEAGEPSSPKGSAATKAFVEFDTLDMAKYLLYSRNIHSTSSGQANKYIYKVPKNEIVVKRAVQKYEKYVRETRSGLVRAFMEKGANNPASLKLRRDKEGAEGLAGLVMEEMKMKIEYLIFNIED